MTAKIVNPISNKVIWQTNELNSNCWAKFPNTEIFSTLIFDRFDNLLWQRAWSVQENGSNLYKKFFYYLLNLKKDKRPKGVAIGTHNGEFGEWVPSVVSDHTDAILVEASNKQFLELEQNYSNKNNVTLLNLLVTKDGKPTKYWEGGRGYTNSIVKRVPEKQETEPIKDTIYPSTNINDLVNESVDWLHLDVEGYDHILIKSLPEVYVLFVAAPVVKYKYLFAAGKTVSKNGVSKPIVWSASVPAKRKDGWCYRGRN